MVKETQKVSSEDKVINSFLKSLGEDFSYPAYDPNSTVAETKLTVDKIKHIIDIKDLSEYLGEADETSETDIILTKLLNDSVSAKLKDGLENLSKITRGLAADDVDDGGDEFDEEHELCHNLLSWTIILNDKIKDVGKAHAWGLDHKQEIKTHVRHTLLINEAIGLPIFVAMPYLAETTKDIPYVKKLFEETPNAADYKSLFRSKGEDKDKGYL